MEVEPPSKTDLSDAVAEAEPSQMPLTVNDKESEPLESTTKHDDESKMGGNAMGRADDKAEADEAVGKEATLDKAGTASIERIPPNPPELPQNNEAAAGSASDTNQAGKAISESMSETRENPSNSAEAAAETLRDNHPESGDCQLHHDQTQTTEPQVSSPPTPEINSAGEYFTRLTRRTTQTNSLPHEHPRHPPRAPGAGSESPLLRRESSQTTRPPEDIALPASPESEAQDQPEPAPHHPTPPMTPQPAAVQRPAPPLSPPPDSPPEEAIVDEELNEELNETIKAELRTRWILNVSMHFREGSPREKFFITYAELATKWRRVTASVDYGSAPPDSLERELQGLLYQREKSARIYEALRDSLAEIRFFDTVTNLRLETSSDDRLHVHVTEDVNEIIPYPKVDLVAHLNCRLVQESQIHFDSHMSGFVYKVRVDDRVMVKKEIPSQDSVTEFLYEVDALHALIGAQNVIQLEAIVVDEARELVKGLLISYAENGTLVDLIYDDKGRLSWNRRQKWARQIVNGLSEIHEAGFVQGDFTLSNIVIDENDNARIIDINRRGCPVGWEPPELVGHIKAGQRISMMIGVKSDLFQLGMVLYGLAEEQDEPERKPRPLSLDSKFYDPPIEDYYLDITRRCLDPVPKNRLSAAQLLAMFPQMEDFQLVNPLLDNLDNPTLGLQHDIPRSLTLSDAASRADDSEAWVKDIEAKSVNTKPETFEIDPTAQLLGMDPSVREIEPYPTTIDMPFDNQHCVMFTTPGSREDLEELAADPDSPPHGETPDDPLPPEHLAPPEVDLGVDPAEDETTKDESMEPLMLTVSPGGPMRQQHFSDGHVYYSEAPVSLLEQLRKTEDNQLRAGYFAGATTPPAEPEAKQIEAPPPPQPAGEAAQETEGSGIASQSPERPFLESAEKEQLQTTENSGTQATNTDSHLVSNDRDNHLMNNHPTDSHREDHLQENQDAVETVSPKNDLSDWALDRDQILRGLEHVDSGLGDMHLERQATFRGMQHVDSGLGDIDLPDFGAPHTLPPLAEVRSKADDSAT